VLTTACCAPFISVKPSQAQSGQVDESVSDTDPLLHRNRRKGPKDVSKPRRWLWETNMRARGICPWTRSLVKRAVLLEVQARQVGSPRDISRVSTARFSALGSSCRPHLSGDATAAETGPLQCGHTGQMPGGAGCTDTENRPRPFLALAALAMVLFVSRNASDVYQSERFFRCVQELRRPQCPSPDNPVQEGFRPSAP
jgi:hypothetical protein